MELIKTFGVAVTFCAIAVLLALNTQPQTKNVSALRRFNLAILLVLALGVLILLLYAIIVYRIGTDGGWWPLIAALSVTSWVVVVCVVVCVIGAVSRWLYFRLLDHTN